MVSAEGIWRLKSTANPSYKKEEVSLGKTAYFECYSGISGDMTVAALLDLGANPEKLKRHWIACIWTDILFILAVQIKMG